MVERVADDRDGYRLDRFLRKTYPCFPSRSVRYAIERGDVFVNGTRSVKGRILKAGDEVDVRRIAEPEDWLPVVGNVPGASILYEDRNSAVLMKPADVHTEPQRPLEAGTMSGYLLWRHPEVLEISREPGLTLLTRLDYATSGTVPAALSSKGFEFLRREREHGRIVKTYICLVAGRLEREMSLSFALDTSGGEKVRVRKDRREDDPSYWTSVSPIRISGDSTVIRATISKGKRHQIRAHLAAAGFPIVGDRRYGAVPEDGPGKNRLMLHAAEVRFANPDGDETVSVSAPLPCEFERYFKD